MKRETEAVLLRIFIGEFDHYNGKPLYLHLLQEFKKHDVAGATVLRGMAGYGQTSRIHTTTIERLSTDLPIVVEVVDIPEQIEKVKKLLDGVVTSGMITEEKVKIFFYDGIEKA